MSKFTNQKVIELFVKGGMHDYKTVESHTGNLWITDDKRRLMNYSTCLAEKDYDKGYTIVNITKYSVTTSKIQNWLRGELWTMDTVQVENVPQGEYFLSKYIETEIELG